MKMELLRKLVLLFITLCLLGCGSRVVYFDVMLEAERAPPHASGEAKVYKSTKPHGTLFKYQPIVYEDDTLTATFFVTGLYIRAKVENKLEKPIVLLWDKATISSQQGQSTALTNFEYILQDSRVVGRTFKQIDPVTVAAKSPSFARLKPDYQKIYQSGEIFNIDMNKEVQASDRGNQFILTLPVRVEEQELQYQWTFVVQDYAFDVSYY